MLGYLRSSDDNRALRTATVSSHVQLMRDYPDPPVGSRTLDAALVRLNAVRDQLWNRWIPAMVGAYFEDLLLVLTRVAASLSPGGRCWIVIGDSSYAGIAIPAATIVAELLEERSWTIHENTAFRRMRSSVQQGWQSTLNESLLVVEP
jgi:hypothetical protein